MIRKITIKYNLKRVLDMITEAGNTDGKSVEFFVFVGEVDTTNVGRAYGYKQLIEPKVEGEELLFGKVDGTFCFKKKLEGAWSIGDVTAVFCTNSGQTAITKTGIGVARWYDEDDIAGWEATAERRKVDKFVKAQMKDHGFDNRLRDALEPIRLTYKSADLITRQYILAKMINFLNK
jgi:hypothetical protein